MKQKRRKPSSRRFCRRIAAMLFVFAAVLPFAARALADGIPAESYAAGANKLADENPQWGDDRNRNMPRMPSVVEAWERLYGVGHNQAWKHSDIKNRPYQVVRDVFLSIVEEGNLR